MGSNPAVGPLDFLFKKKNNNKTSGLALIVSFDINNLFGNIISDRVEEGVNR